MSERDVAVDRDGGDQRDDSGERTGRATAEANASVTPTEQLARLRAENERLRREYQRSRRVEYGRTAAGLALVGVTAVAAGLLLPSVQEVLIVVGSIGLFAAILTRFLAPEQFIPVDVAEGIYDSIHESRSALVAELELAGEARYVPTPGGVRLFVPQHDGAALPDADALEATLVVPDDDRRGVAFAPSGEALFRAFRRTLGESLVESPRTLSAQLATGLSEGLELVDAASVDVDESGARASMRLSGVPFGAVDRFDHPVASFVGVGLATGLGTAVRLVDARTDDGDAVVSYTWDADGGGDGPAEADAATADATTDGQTATATDGETEPTADGDTNGEVST